MLAYVGLGRDYVGHMLAYVGPMLSYVGPILIHLGGYVGHMLRRLSCAYTLSLLPTWPAPGCQA